MKSLDICLFFCLHFFNQLLSYQDRATADQQWQESVLVNAINQCVSQSYGEQSPLY